MNTTNDNVFGLMEYNYSWKKTDKLDLWGRIFEITIIANDLDKTGITAAQQKAYSSNKKSFSDKINAYVDDIVKFCVQNYQLQDIIIPEVISHLTPTSILFQQDGSWGILMDSTYDIENGLVLYFKDDIGKVDTQDVFL